MRVMKAHKKNKKESAGFHVAQNLKIYTALQLCWDWVRGLFAVNARDESTREELKREAWAPRRPKILRFTLQSSSAETEYKAFLPPKRVMKAHSITSEDKYPKCLYRKLHSAKYTP